MDPKKLKQEHDEAQRRLSTANARIRDLETEVVDLRREVLPMRRRRAAGDRVVAGAAAEVVSRVRDAAGASAEAADAIEAALKQALDVVRERGAWGAARMREAGASIEGMALKLQVQAPPDNDDLADALDGASQRVTVLKDRVSFLEEELEGFRKDAIAANAETDRLRARMEIAEKVEASLYHFLTRHLPRGWQGQTLKDLAATMDGRNGLNRTLVECLTWVNARAARLAGTEPPVETAPVPATAPEAAGA